MNKLLLKAATGVLVAAGLLGAGYWQGGRVAKAEFALFRNEVDTERRLWDNRSMRFETNLRAEQAKAKERYDADKNLAYARLRSILERLRDHAPSIPAEVAEGRGPAGGDGAGATGTALLDGEVLARISAGADEIARRLALCQKPLELILRATSEVAGTGDRSPAE